MKNKSYIKIAAILALALAVATSLWFTSPAAPCRAQGAYDVGAAGGGAGGIPPSYTWLGSMIDYKGAFTKDASMKTSDELCQITIKKGTTALNRIGDPLISILMVQTKVPLTPPQNAKSIGLTYQLSPEGATFDPAIKITFTYDPSDIPPGANEGDLVIAFRDKETNEWVTLKDSTVNESANAVSASVGHFTDFAVFSFTRPAAFTASSLTISPTEVDPGQDITIGATVANSGDLAGSYIVTLKIDNVVTATKEITLAGHASQKVTFTAKTGDVAGNYAVSINGLSGTFTVKVPSAPAPAPAPTPAPAPAPAPTPTPTPTPAPAPTPTPTPAPAPAPTPTPTPAPAPTPTPTPVNWWLIGGAIIAITIVAIIMWLIALRRRD